MSETFDVAIIGGGIAGASLAAFLSPATRAVVIEGETLPGYHTTGRSAAFYSETYGGPAVQPLSTASKAFFHAPPPGFGPLLSPRGALYVAREAATLDALAAEFADSGVQIERLDAAATLVRAPMLRPAWTACALWEPDCADIDVAELHRGLLATARANGTRMMADAMVEGLTQAGADWTIATRGGTVRAAVVVNAAGAWADSVAAMAGAAPLGIAPLRRTIAQVATDPPAPAATPLVLDAAGEWYFKPEGGRLWLSPHDEVPDAAGDAQPDEIDVATAIDRFEAATTSRVTRLERAWAGLRSFAPDRAPVYGWDAAVPGFFWCAGQGGFGIQTAPAAGMLAAALVERRALPGVIEAAGIDAARYAPGRFRA